MVKQPLVSVVVPVYNQEKYFESALQSIIDQDYPEIEIIVVDDGSTDRTCEIAESTLRRGGRPYQMISQKNGGAHAAINHCMILTKGEYVTIHNSDDLFMPGRLSIMMAALTASDKRFAFSLVTHIDPNGNPHPYEEHYLRQVAEARSYPSFYFEFLQNNIAATTGNFLFHRSLYDEIGAFAPYYGCHDWDFFLRVLLVEEPLFIDQVLYQYRIHSLGTLQINLEKVNGEIEQLMVDYFSRLNQAANPRAPGPRWGAFWDEFSETHLERIRALPRVNALLEEMKAETERLKELENQPPSLQRPQSILGPLNFTADLDLTQPEVRIPQLDKNGKGNRRLLLILPWMVMGGAERFVLNMIDQLQVRNWQVSIACTTPSENAWKAEFARRTEDIFILPDILPVKDYLRFFRYLIAQRDFDAVLLQGSIEGYRLLPALRALFPRLPILDYLHFVTPDWMDGGFPRLSYLYRDGIDLTITSCQQVKNWMIEQGMDENHLRVCLTGVDARCWQPDPVARSRMRQSLNIGDEETVLVYAARLEEQKQPLVFAETARLLMEQGVPFRALVAGDGSLRASLERKIQQNRLSDHVTLLGAIETEDMPALLAAADVLFLPSQNEGISSAAYEAMACGLPVVGADVGGQSELVTAQCGVLIPFKSPDQQALAYAGALRELFADQARMRSMGAAGRARILEHFSYDEVGEKISAIFDEVIRLKRDGKLAPPKLTDEERFRRDAQHVIEYLQARQEWRKLNAAHGDLYHSYKALSQANTELAQRNAQLEQANAELGRTNVELSQQHAQLEQAHVELKQSFDDLSQKYFELIQPKPASHWFYLWIRQLFLPVFTRLKGISKNQTGTAPQKWLKRLLTKE